MTGTADGDHFTETNIVTYNSYELTLVCIANEEFDQAAHFRHLLLPRGQCSCCDIGFARLHAFCLLLDITLQISGNEKMRQSNRE